MFDGVFQSVIVWYMPYFLFAPATFNTSSGLTVNDSKRVGVYAAHASIVVVNAYILLNTYRWDWLTVLIAVLSMLLPFFWTGVYSAGQASFTFYRAAPQAFGQLSFWAVTFLTVIICLTPRFTGKSYQKMFRPRDVDIIREQIRQGKFDDLKDSKKSHNPIPGKTLSASSSEFPNPIKQNGHSDLPEDERPIYPPSVAPTATTHNPRSHNGSDGTDYTGHRSSLDQRPARFSLDRPRPSFDRFKTAMERTRASIEASRDFTSAAMLSRIESSHQHDHGQDDRIRLDQVGRAH